MKGACLGLPYEECWSAASIVMPGTRTWLLHMSWLPSDLLSLHVDKLNNRQLQVATCNHSSSQPSNTHIPIHPHTHTHQHICIYKRPSTYGISLSFAIFPAFPTAAWLLRFLRFEVPASLMCNWHFSTCCGISPTTSTSHLQTLTLTCFLLIFRVALKGSKPTTERN